MLKGYYPGEASVEASPQVWYICYSGTDGAIYWRPAVNEHELMMADKLIAANNHEEAVKALSAGLPHSDVLNYYVSVNNYSSSTYNGSIQKRRFPCLTRDVSAARAMEIIQEVGSIQLSKKMNRWNRFDEDKKFLFDLAKLGIALENDEVISFNNDQAQLYLDCVRQDEQAEKRRIKKKLALEKKQSEKKVPTCTLNSFLDKLMVSICRNNDPYVKNYKGKWWVKVHPGKSVESKIEACVWAYVSLINNRNNVDIGHDYRPDSPEAIHKSSWYANIDHLDAMLDKWIKQVPELAKARKNTANKLRAYINYMANSYSRRMKKTNRADKKAKKLTQQKDQQPNKQ